MNTVRWGVNDLHRSGMMDALTRRCATGQLDAQWLMIRSGIVSIIFGILLITQPGAGAIAIVWRLRA